MSDGTQTAAQGHKLPQATVPTSGEQLIQQRPDIDGLRAIAVIPVIAFHFAHRLVPGGYIGVDIFFVISGYLITTLLNQRLAFGTYSLLTFYGARIRRIFPALFAMLATSTIVAMAVLPPFALQEFGKTLISTAMFYSNIEFYHLSDYFEGSATLKSLLHTWSLAVEEQFYILYPLLLATVHRRLASWKGTLILLLAAVSLSASIYLARYQASFSFYFAGSRAHELLIGAFLAIAVRRSISHRVLNEVVALFGFALIIFALFSFTEETIFPGIHALVPCIGAAMIIYTGSNRHTQVSKVLSLQPIRQIGLLSYSLYLWHWPILVFMRHAVLGEPSAALVWLALALAVGASFFSHRFIETPFRRTKNSDWHLLAYACLFISAAVLVGNIFVSTSGLRMRFSDKSLDLFRFAGDSSPLRKKCHGGDARPIAYANNCILGQPGIAPSVAVWGDSHGAELSVALGESLARDGRSVMEITSSSCPPSMSYIPPQRQSCVNHNRLTLNALVDDRRISTVVLISFYSYYLESKPAGFAAGLKSTVDELLAHGKHVVLLEPVPHYKYPVPDALGMLVFRGQLPELFGQRRTEYFEENAPALEIIRNIAKTSAVKVIRTSSILCKEQRCEVLKNGSVLYFDEDHLSLSGARLLSPAVRTAVIAIGRPIAAN